MGFGLLVDRHFLVPERLDRPNTTNATTQLGEPCLVKDCAFCKPQQRAPCLRQRPGIPKKVS